MKWAVISDIHANLMALQEVVNHIKTQGVNGILCTGDLVVFGPHPNECVELIFSLLRERWDKRCMMGNNDQAVVLNRHSEGLSRIAIVSQKWTSRVVSAENRLRLSRLSKAPIIYKNHWTIVHGTLSDPIGEFTYMDYNDFTIRESFRALQTPLGFFGHVHRPAIYKAAPRLLPHVFSLERVYPQHTRLDNISCCEVSYAEDLSQGKKLLVNAGSVGQPRDGDPRAGYVIINEQRQVLQFYRIPYDIQSVQSDMRAIGAPETLIERLGQGL